MMIKRIILLSGDKGPSSELKQMLASRDALVLEPGASDALPAHGTALLHADDVAQTTLLDAVFGACAQSNALLGLIAQAIDAREDIPADASERVRRCAVQLGEALALSREELSQLERGALLRGIGKIRIPNSVLLKATVLDYDDWLLLQSHTTLGAEMLIEQGVCGDVAEIAHYYHECWDGTGYPEGLEGEAIPRLARIMRLVDVYCAMTSPRVYRKTHATHEEAVAHIKSERGKHFDPSLVDVFIENDIGH